MVVPKIACLTAYHLGIPPPENTSVDTVSTDFLCLGFRARKKGGDYLHRLSAQYQEHLFQTCHKLDYSFILKSFSIKLNSLHITACSELFCLRVQKYFVVNWFFSCSGARAMLAAYKIHNLWIFICTMHQIRTQ